MLQIVCTHERVNTLTGNNKHAVMGKLEEGGADNRNPTFLHAIQD